MEKGFGEKVSSEQMTEWFEAPLEKVFPTKTKDKGDLDTPVTVARPQIVARKKVWLPTGCHSSVPRNQL